MAPGISARLGIGLISLGDSRAKARTGVIPGIGLL